MVFEKANPFHLAVDVEGNPYLAASEWMLQFVEEKWPEITFFQTPEYNSRNSIDKL